MIHRVKQLLLILILLSGSFMVSTAQDNEANLNMRVYEAVDTDYPIIQVYFSLYDLTNGTTINNLSPEDFTMSYDGQIVEVESIEPSPASRRDVHLSLLFDLTGSVSRELLERQQRLALQLIDNLEVNDLVAVTSFDGNEPTPEVMLTNDHNAARNAINGLRANTSGVGNVFIDAMLTTVRALEDGANATNVRRMVVAMTDIGNDQGRPPQGDSRASEAITLANQLNASAYMIGFNEADQNILNAYAETTNGYTYPLLEVQDIVGVDSVARNLSEIMQSEFVLTGRALAPANGDTSNLVITAQVGSREVSEIVTAITARPRRLIVSFPAQPETPKYDTGDTITFRPDITYANYEEEPAISSVVYDSQPPVDTLPEPQANGDLSWTIGTLPAGTYVITVTITDENANQGSASTLIEVVGDTTVAIVEPQPPAQGEELLIPAEPVDIVASVNSSFEVAPDNVDLLVNNEPADIVPVDAGEGRYIFTWDASEREGSLFDLQVNVTDENGQEAQATLRSVRVQITDIDWYLFLTAGFLLAILIAFLVVVLTILRRRRTPQEEVLIDDGFDNLSKAEQFDQDGALLNRDDVNRQPPAYGEDETAFDNKARKRNRNTSRSVLYDLQMRKEYPLPPEDGGAITIGRNTDEFQNTIDIQDKRVSRRHGIIQNINGNYVYSDVVKGTRSVDRDATLHNDKPLRKGAEIQLNDGDILTIGDAEFRFEDY